MGEYAAVCVVGASGHAPGREPSANAGGRLCDEGASASLAALAGDFSPRYERHGDDVVIDVSGLGRLLGEPRAIGEELRRSARARGLTAHVAVASTQTAARLLARARPGLTIVERGKEREALASLRLEVLALLTAECESLRSSARREKVNDAGPQLDAALSVFKRWGLKTLGDLAALPPADLASRLGRPALAWQAMARGEDRAPLVPAIEDERFDGSIELEWPIEGLEPLSFVLTRLLEPLSTRLERRDRGAAVLHVRLDLVSDDTHARRLDLPSPIRDVRTLRTLALLDLEAHPPTGAIDRVTVVIEPTPGRIVQHALFTRPQPTPDQIATLLARLAAVIGQDRIGAPVEADSHEPGAFLMKPFRESGGAPAAMPAAASAQHDAGARHQRAVVAAPEALRRASPELQRRRGPREKVKNTDGCFEAEATTALRRYRRPLPARVTVSNGVPVRVTIDRRGAGGGAIVRAAGPWRTSGHWWSACGHPSGGGRLRARGTSASLAGTSAEAGAPRERQECLPWSRDEWDIALGDGTVYRIFQDRATDGWFVDAIVD